MNIARRSNIGDALTASPLSQFAATTSAQLRGVISDETGTGAAVFANSPSFVTPVLGTPSSGSLTSCTGYEGINVRSLDVTDVGRFLGSDGDDSSSWQVIPWTPPPMIIHNSAGVVAENTAGAHKIPANITTINNWYAICKDSAGEVITTNQTITIQFRMKAWTSSAWVDTTSANVLSGTQIVFSAAAPSKLSNSPSLGTLSPGQFLQMAVLSVTGTDIKTVEVIIDAS